MMEERITSRKNPLLQQVRKLLSSGKARKEAGLFVSDGTKLLEEAVKYDPDGLDTVILSDGVQIPVPGHVRVVRVPGDVMESISPMQTPQGAMFLCRLPQKTEFAPKPGMLEIVAASEKTVRLAEDRERGRPRLFEFAREFFGAEVFSYQALARARLFEFRYYSSAFSRQSSGEVARQSGAARDEKVVELQAMVEELDVKIAGYEALDKQRLATIADLQAQLTGKIEALDGESGRYNELMDKLTKTEEDLAGAAALLAETEKANENAAAQLDAATMIRLLPFSARITATIRAAAPLTMCSVSYKMAGKVMAVRQATGT